MVTELDKIIDFVNYITKPENHLLLITIIGVIVTALTSFGVKILMYLLKRRHIPKLACDGIWKQNTNVGTDYFLKVKRDKGEGEAEGVKGFVGIEDKIGLNPSIWIDRNIETDITTYNYLSLFKIFEHKGHEIITFHTREISSPPDDNNLYETNRYNQYKDDKIIVEIEATRARIRKRKITKKIKNIVKDAKPIPP
jgi:hypothetical protein